MRRLWLLVALVLATVAPSAQRINPKDASTVPRITQMGFQPLQSEGKVLVLDVRDEKAFAEGHIPGAMNVPLMDVEKRLDDIKVRVAGRPIVLYCACPAEHSAAEAGLVLYKHGVTDIRALLGGYHEWVRAGGKVEKGGAYLTR
jgi:rhodanese-related sulfurtransferase